MTTCPSKIKCILIAISAIIIAYLVVFFAVKNAVEDAVVLAIDNYYDTHDFDIKIL